MPILHYCAYVVLIGTAVAAVEPACGQGFPNKPVRIVTAGVGGGSDFLARLIAQGISGSLGQQVIVANYPSGVIPGLTVSKSPPDGYTLLVAGPILWIGPLLRDDTPYDPVRDFSPIATLVTEPNVLVVHPSLPVKTASELVVLTKARPGEVNYAASVAGSQSQLAAELFKYMAGVKIQVVPYTSGSVRIAELIGGQTQVTIDGPGGMMPHVKSGRLKALAVTSLQRTALVPGLPTVAESGLPGYESVGRTGMFAPAKTPETIVRRLNQEIVRYLSLAETKTRLFETGVDVVGSSPEELAAEVNTQRDLLGRVIKAAGIRAQ